LTSLAVEIKNENFSVRHRRKNNIIGKNLKNLFRI